MRSGPYSNKTKEYRQLRKMTQIDLARRLQNRGFRASGAYISQIEAGLKRVPYGLALAICEELGLESKQVTEVFLPQYFTAGLKSESTYRKGRRKEIIPC